MRDRPTQASGWELQRAWASAPWSLGSAHQPCPPVARSPFGSRCWMTLRRCLRYRWVSPVFIFCSLYALRVCFWYELFTLKYEKPGDLWNKAMYQKLSAYFSLLRFDFVHNKIIYLIVKFIKLQILQRFVMWETIVWVHWAIIYRCLSCPDIFISALPTVVTGNHFTSWHGNQIHLQGAGFMNCCADSSIQLERSWKRESWKLWKYTRLGKVCKTVSLSVESTVEGENIFLWYWVKFKCLLKTP